MAVAVPAVADRLPAQPTRFAARCRLTTDPAQPRPGENLHAKHHPPDGHPPSSRRRRPRRHGRPRRPGVAAPASADIVYDFRAGSVTSLTSNPAIVGDFGTLAGDLGPNEAYQINSITVTRVTRDTTGDVQIGLFVYDEYDADAADGTPAFVDLLSARTFDRTVTSDGTNAIATTSVNYDPGDLTLTDPNFAFIQVFAEPDTIGVDDAGQPTYTPNTKNVTAAFGPNEDGIGSSTDGYVRDVDGDGLLESNEFRVFGTGPERANLYTEIDATIVLIPEPATAGLAAAAAAGLMLRRRRGGAA